MRHFHALALLLALPSFAATARADDAAEILAARKFVEPMFAKACEFEYDADGTPSGYNNVYKIPYRSPSQEQDSPDKQSSLIELHCASAAYNFSSLYVISNPEEDLRLLAFPEPRPTYDYTDENFTHLKSPPKVTGFSATSILLNPEYDAETRTIVATAKWRGVGDAWSMGQWQFVDGTFVLKKYEIDPTYQDNSEDNPNPDEPESYVVYDSGDAPKASEAP